MIHSVHYRKMYTHQQNKIITFETNNASDTTENEFLLLFILFKLLYIFMSLFFKQHATSFSFFQHIAFHPIIYTQRCSRIAFITSSWYNPSCTLKCIFLYEMSFQVYILNSHVRQTFSITNPKNQLHKQLQSIQHPKLKNSTEQNVMNQNETAIQYTDFIFFLYSSI